MTLLTAFDSLSAPGERVTLRALFERRALGVLRFSISGAMIRFTTEDGRDLGASKTEGDGIATLTLDKLPPRPFQAIAPDGARDRANHFVFRPEEPALACDLDLTISDAPPLVFWVSPMTQVLPFADAPDVLRSIGSKFHIIYLTARRDLFLRKTRAWLDHYLFPSGPIFSRPWSFFPISPGAYKRTVLKTLRHRFPGLKIGIGDRLHDVEAYESAGLEPILFRPNGRGPAGIRTCSSWAEIPSTLSQICK